MSRLPIAVALLLAGALPAPAQTVLPGQSDIAFTTRQMGVPVDGRFTRWTARVALDPKRPEAGSVALLIDASSARFGAPETDAEVAKPAWLAAAKLPQASFESTSIRAAGGGRYEVAGRLTIKGSTRDVVVPVQLSQAGSSGTASGSFTIRRLDFKVGEGEWADTGLVADDVLVRFRFALAGLAPP